MNNFKTCATCGSNLIMLIRFCQQLLYVYKLSYSLKFIANTLLSVLAKCEKRLENANSQ